jgi:flagellar protein FliO/FliZ
MTVQTMLLVVGVLVGIIALISVIARFFRFSGWSAQSGSGRTLVLKESIALDPRRRMHLVQCGQRQVVLLTGGGQDLVVGWMREP